MGVIGIDTNIEDIVRPQSPTLRYQFLFYYDETKLMMNKPMLSM